MSFINDPTLGKHPDARLVNCRLSIEANMTKSVRAGTELLFRYGRWYKAEEHDYEAEEIQSGWGEGPRFVESPYLSANDSTIDAGELVIHDRINKRHYTKRPLRHRGGDA